MFMDFRVVGRFWKGMAGKYRCKKSKRHLGAVSYNTGHLNDTSLKEKRHELTQRPCG